MLAEHLIFPDWPAPVGVKALQTTRKGGVSLAPYDTLNLGLHVGDDPVRVNRNRQSLAPLMPSEPVWLEQVHGTLVANADLASCVVQADACVARQRGSVCVVMTADCLPVLLCDMEGSVVAAVHAGWKGLAAGVIEATVRAMDVSPRKLIAWLGPAISKEFFEVGDEVRAAFVAAQRQATAAFIPSPHPSPSVGAGASSSLPGSESAPERAREGAKYLADIYALARLRLQALGIRQVFGGNRCTYRERDKFFSYRRDRVTGRMGTFIWLG